MERHKIHYRETPYISRWAHTERLSFLKDCLKIRGQSRNISHLQNNADGCQVSFEMFYFIYLCVYTCARVVYEFLMSYFPTITS